jgi:hypothetical protein
MVDIVNPGRAPIYLSNLTEDTLGTETYKVAVRELTGAERDRSYGKQARRYPGFAERVMRNPINSWYSVRRGGQATVRPVDMKEVLTPFFMTGRTVAFSPYDRSFG